MPGDEVEDDSGNGNTGTLNDDAKIVKGGRFGSALSVSGKGHIDCGNADVLNQEFPGLTVGVWVNPTATDGIRQPVCKWQMRLRKICGVCLLCSLPAKYRPSGLTSKPSIRRWYQA